MTDYAILRARERIDALGVAATLRRIVRTEIPATGKVTEVATDHSVKAVIGAFKLHQIDGTVVKQGDRRVTIAADGLSITPEANDRLLFGTEVFEVLSSEPKHVGSLVAAHVLHVRH